MKYSFFYIPFLYFIKTRISSFFKLISWGIIYIIPTLYIFFHYSQLSHLQSILIYGLLTTIVYTLYEVGYIQNDTETIKRELSPTMRLDFESLNYYEKNKFNIYLVRIIIGFTLLYLLYVIKLYPNSSLFLFLLGIISILVVYQIYNRIRNFFNLILHFILVCIRFLSFTLLFFNEIKSYEFFFLLFIFPFLNLIERASSKRFKMHFLQKMLNTKSNFAKFRASYYFIITILFLLLYVSFEVPIFWIIYLCIFLFIYRLLTIKI